MTESMVHSVMKTFQLEYTLKITLDHEIHHHYFSLRCLPKTEACQELIFTKIRLNADYFSYSQDCFGNHFLYGYKEEPSHMLDVYVKSQIRTDYCSYDFNNHLNSVFCRPTEKTAVGENLYLFYEECASACISLPNNYEKALRIMKLLCRRMKYEKGVTTIRTAADDAFGPHCGVCQNYAQIMIAILRSMRIPARYVAGAVKNLNLTHAWVEVFSEDRWYGLDPTNDLLVNDDYIIFSRGRDYRDCLVNKGIFYSSVPVQQKQDVLVQIQEMQNSICMPAER
ncbi:Transglutaminase-like enzyme, putative cysteine protease [Megasphaera cerevisiae DSM 20462]|nr:Transglutaminase-like enzyme, putative cysteine protease [Megasphaera cerevisiae DSM 20462]